MKAILTTRPAGQDDPLTRLLERRGYRVLAVPTVTTVPVKLEASDLEACDWVVFTSVRGVEALADVPAGPRYAAVGAKTADALRARGVEPAHVPPRADGATLADTMPEVEGKRVALVRASAAEGDLPARLRSRGAKVEEMTAYRTVEGPGDSRAALAAALAAPDLRAVVFASGSAVRGFLKLGGAASWPAITIGPRTSAAARELGFDVIAEAGDQSAESLAAAVAAAVPLQEGDHA